MKTARYHDKDFAVPNWAKFIAADDDGEVFVYDVKPIKYHTSGIWDAPPGAGNRHWVGKLDIMFPCDAIP